jgi:hypothetical protein
LLVQSIVLQRVWGNTLQVLVRRHNVIAELLHFIEFVAEQLISISIRIG